MRIIIIEDEVLLANRLERLIKSIDADIDVVAQLHSVQEIVDFFLQPREVDLIMADIRLGDGLVFDALQSLGIKTHIVFITAYDEYAIKAFKFNSIDYILKPPTKEAIVFALKKAEEMRNPTSLSQTLEFIRNPLALKYRQRFVCDFGGGTLKPIDVNDVSYINISYGIVRIFTDSGKGYVIDGSMDKIEAELDPKLFFRANRQYIVNINAIDRVINLWNRKIQIKLRCKVSEDVPILISKEKITRFKKWMKGSGS